MLANESVKVKKLDTIKDIINRILTFKFILIVCEEYKSTLKVWVKIKSSKKKITLFSKNKTAL